MQARIAKKRKKKTFVKAIFSLNWEVASGDHIHGGLLLRLYLNQFKGKCIMVDYFERDDLNTASVLIFNIWFLFCLRASKRNFKMGLDCGMRCLKFLLCVFNLVFWVSQASKVFWGFSRVRFFSSHHRFAFIFKRKQKRLNSAFRSQCVWL